VNHDIALARGLIDSAGARHRRVRLRPLSGVVELEFAERGNTLVTLDSEEAHDFLASLTARIGGFDQPSPEIVAGLSRGDRARLALACRSMLLGDTIVLIVQCQVAGCAALADLSLQVSTLLGDLTVPQPLELLVKTAVGELSVRPPTGEDLRFANGDNDALWGQIVSDSGGALGALGWRALDRDTSQAVVIALAGLDACADLAFVMACPQCGGWIEVELDPLDLLVRSLSSGEHRLLAEVHSLAFHYGWSETEILNLSRPRRLVYLELLRNQIEGRPLGVN
jgi:hypothetical protein